MSGDYWLNKKTKTISIYSIINDKLIILIFEKQLKIKFIYFGKEKLIQLTADFSSDEFNIKILKIKLKNILLIFDSFWIIKSPIFGLINLNYIILKIKSKLIWKLININLI